jgi:hypothetical protein
LKMSIELEGLLKKRAEDSTSDTFDD